MQTAQLQTYAPRARRAFIAAVTPKRTKPNGRDLVALRVVVSGVKNGAPHSTTFDLIDYFDEVHHISARMRCTGYSLSLTGLTQVRHQVIRAERPARLERSSGGETMKPSSRSV